MRKKILKSEVAPHGAIHIQYHNYLNTFLVIRFLVVLISVVTDLPIFNLYFHFEMN